jgi:cytochrome c-type biogenesis protein
MGGRAASVTGETAIRAQLKVLSNAALFVAGFSTVFIAFGAGAGLIGADLRAFRPLLLQVAGIALVIMGLALLGLAPWLMREARIDVAHRLPRGPWGSYLVGLAFAAGWTPCLGPTLGAILQVAANLHQFNGLPFMLVYCLGLAIPFLVLAAVADKAQFLVQKFSRAHLAINLVSGALLMVFALLLITNRITVLNTFSFQAPFNL